MRGIKDVIKLNNNEVTLVTFPNKERRLDLNEEHLNVNNIITWKYENDSSIFELLLADNVMTQLNHTYDLVITYMPYSRMDRVEKTNTAFSLDVLANLLSKQLQKVKKVYVFDPHSSVTLEKLKEYGLNAQELNYSLADDVISTTNVDVNKSWIVFPDHGAAKRYDASEYPNVIICEKKRDFATGRIINLKATIHTQNGSPSHNAPLIVIDDLSSYGGTFIRALQAVDTLGIAHGESWLIISHAEEAVHKGDLLKTYDKLFTTDSLWITTGMELLKSEPRAQINIKLIDDIISDQLQ